MTVGILTRHIAIVAATGALAGCNPVILRPAGDIALQQRDLLVFATALILLIVIPLVLAVLIFAWRYRADGGATYDPDTQDSARLTALVWSGPLIIIVVLATTTWLATHRLDPYRPIDRIGPNEPVAPGTQVLTIQVVALDWKWLFIYPQLGLATVNEFAAPVDTPIRFEITSATVMNSFFVPALAGQIYAMAGMETKLHAIVSVPGHFEGFSANYSGAGFSRMRFKVLGLDRGQFETWVARAKIGNSRLDAAAYLQLTHPSEATPVSYFGSVEEGLYEAVLRMCVGKPSDCRVHPMHQTHVTRARHPVIMRGLDTFRRPPWQHAATSAVDDASICRAEAGHDGRTAAKRMGVPPL